MCRCARCVLFSTARPWWVRQVLGALLVRRGPVDQFSKSDSSAARLSQLPRGAENRFLSSYGVVSNNTFQLAAVASVTGHHGRTAAGGNTDCLPSGLESLLAGELSHHVTQDVCSKTDWLTDSFWLIWLTCENACFKPLCLQPAPLLGTSNFVHVTAGHIDAGSYRPKNTPDHAAFAERVHA